MNAELADHVVGRRHHATSSKVVQPILEPRRLARSEALRVPSKVPAVSWADVERLDAALAAMGEALATLAVR